MFSKLIQASEKYSLPSETSGQWSAIQLRFNSFSPEYLNIGVVFFSAETGYSIKLLDNFYGLKTLLHNEFDESHFKELLSITENCISKSGAIGNISSPSSAIRFTPPSFFSGSSPESITNWLFDECVMLSKCIKERKKNEFKTKSDKEIRNNIFNIIKKEDKNSDNFLCDHDYMLRIDDGTTCLLDIPIMTDKKAGVISNGWLKNWESIKGNILVAHADIGAVSKRLNRTGGLFLQRPDDTTGLSTDELSSLDAHIAELLWKIKASNIRVFQRFGEEELAHDIIRFANSAA